MQLGPAIVLKQVKTSLEKEAIDGGSIVTSLRHNPLESLHSLCPSHSLNNIQRENDNEQQ